MHELGTVFYVIREVEQVVEENHLTKVASVTLEIGEVSGIDSSAELKECSQIIEGVEKRMQFLAYALDEGSSVCLL